MARSNSLSGWGKINMVAAVIVTSVGIIWVVNLPYPMIRWPVAQKAPILLLPSYISMDYHYRRAIALVEQADQLINYASSPADFELGEIKVKDAQQDLDALPVWFLGYWPQPDIFWFRWHWQFTLDEFKSARTRIGRMQAKLFQEKNAQTQLSQALQALNAAKRQYQLVSAGAERFKALTSWQAALDHLEQIPSATLAGRTAPTKVSFEKRELKEVTGLAAVSARTTSSIEAAQQFALAAAQAQRNPPHQAIEWEEIAAVWQQAINQLEQVPQSDPGSVEAKKFLVKYQLNLELARTRLRSERESVSALEQAQSQIQTLISSTLAEGASANKDSLINRLQGVINQLETVQSGTTAYSKAQDLLGAAKRKIQQLHQVNGLPAVSARTTSLIEAAQQFALAAAQVEQNPPHQVIEWEEITTLWQQAINQAEQVSSADPGYVEAKKLQVKYQLNLERVRTNLQAERESVSALQQAQSQIQNLINATPKDWPSVNRNWTRSQLQSVIDKLETIQAGTTAYPKAQQLLEYANQNMKQLN